MRLLQLQHSVPLYWFSEVRDPNCPICNQCRTRRIDARKTHSDPEDVAHAWSEQIIPAEYPNNIFPPRHLETCRPEISKLDLRTIENGSAACDLPSEGPKKKSWADLTHLVHFADLADLAKISAQKCKKSVPGEGAPT